MHRFLIFLTSLSLFSCASYNYQSKSKNNSLIIKSDNLNQFEVKTGSTGQKISTTNNGQCSVYFNKLKKDNLAISLENSIYDPIQLQIKRSVRADALIKDISLGVFSFGVSFPKN